jgi:hypothetical protein
MTTKEFNENIEYLETTDVSVSDDQLYEDKEYSRELYMFTDGFGDFSICVPELSRDGLLSVLEDYDVNEETLLWWNGRGVPFDNIKDLYDDIENWKNKFIKIAECMPY